MRLLTGFGSGTVSAPKPRILAAVSGGIDSMVMATLLYEMEEFEFGVATVNFKLRGRDSELDQELVRKWCNERKIPVFLKSFDTHEYANEMGISVEMAARKLRYDWFETVIYEQSYDYIAVAHNLNDSVETLFLNLLRGTGIDGITGIKEKNGRIIRPLLDISREEISKFANEQSVPYRIDKTNEESDYSRNRLRNIIFPEFRKINPSFLERIRENIKYFSDASDILSNLSAEVKKRVTSGNHESDILLKIDIEKLLKETSPKYWLYSLLKKYGFNSSQIGMIFDSIGGESGKIFYSKEYTLVKDRDSLILKNGNIKSNSEQSDIFFIDDPGFTSQSFHFYGVTLSFRIFLRSNGFTPEKTSEDIQYLDADTLTFPLEWRRWRSGDKFIPLGMKGYKKLSDFFADLKLDLYRKNLQPVILSRGQIVCLPGLRADNRFKINGNTSRIFEVRVS